jgi:hypothetical protein
LIDFFQYSNYFRGRLQQLHLDSGWRLHFVDDDLVHFSGPFSKWWIPSHLQNECEKKANAPPKLAKDSQLPSYFFVVHVFADISHLVQRQDFSCLLPRKPFRQS